MVDLTKYAISGTEEYIKVPLLTTRGTRKTKVRAEGFENRFGLLKRKDDVFAKKAKVYTRLTGTIRKRPIVDRTKYIYNPEVRAYELYSPERRIRIKTDTGPRSVSQEQLKYLFKRRGGAYVRAKDTDRVVYDKPRREPRKGKIAKSFQIAITRTIIVNGAKHTVIGYSKVQRGDFTDDEMREQARRHVKASVIEHGGKYDYSNVEFVEDEVEEYVKWVYGNGNR